MTSIATENVKDDLRGLFSGQHRHLSETFEALLTAFNVGEREETARLWGRFETELEAHFELEEKHILPKFAHAAPAEVAGLTDEHARIRAKVAQLGVGVDLHFTRADVVAALIAELKAHAEREEALLYRWAEANLDPRLAASMLPK